MMALILFQGLSSLFGGFALVADPTGAVLSMPANLRSSPIPKGISSSKRIAIEVTFSEDIQGVSL